MSTNKTTNYQLHAWETGDKFLRTEINENFGTIDTALGAKAAQSALNALTQTVGTKAAQSGLDALSATVSNLTSVVNGKAQIIIGSYTGIGTGETQQINLGFRPKALLVAYNTGMPGADSQRSGGLLTETNIGYSTTFQFTASGFQVTGYASLAARSPYIYLAMP